MINHIRIHDSRIARGWKRIKTKWAFEMLVYISIPTAALQLVVPQAYRLTSFGLGVAAYGVLVGGSWVMGRIR